MNVDSSDSWEVEAQLLLQEVDDDQATNSDSDCESDYSAYEAEAALLSGEASDCSATACHGCHCRRDESLDEGDCDGRQLIGRGHLPPRAAKRATLEALSDYIATARPAEWDEEAIDCSNIMMYHQAHPPPIPSVQSSAVLRMLLWCYHSLPIVLPLKQQVNLSWLSMAADLPGIGTINAVSYARARSRISYFVLCRRTTRRGSEQRRVARVQHFLLVKAPDKPTLRLAVCDIYEHQPPLCNGGVYVAKAEVFERRAAALPVGALDAVLVSTEPVQPRGEDARKAQYYRNTVGKLYFARHGNMSRLG
ncbi:g8805 [Coccomyxa elongata]